MRTAALAVYGGDLLPDDPYEPWADQPRQRLRLRHREVLRRAERWVDLVTIDPTDEAAHIAVMRTLLAAGDHAGARRQFEMLRHVLRQELDVEPGAEAAALHRQAVASPTVAVAPTPTTTSPLPPVLELLADDTTFVGRTAERTRAAPAVGPRPGRAHAVRARHRRAGDRQEPHRRRAGDGGPRRRRSGPARVVPRGRGRAVRAVPRGDGRGRRFDRRAHGPQRRARRHRRLAHGQRVDGAGAPRPRGHPLVDIDDP